MSPQQDGPAAKPLSLSPLTPAEALKRAMQAPLPERQPKPKPEPKAAKSARPKKKAGKRR